MKVNIICRENHNRHHNTKLKREENKLDQMSNNSTNKSTANTAAPEVSLEISVEGEHSCSGSLTRDISRIRLVKFTYDACTLRKYCLIAFNGIWRKEKNNNVLSYNKDLTMFRIK